jgi:tetratricopeptide (TPR) repeat protein
MLNSSSIIKHVVMKNSRLTSLLLVLLFPLLLTGQVTELPMMPASGITSYGNLPVAQLNRAHRQQLTGQFELALLTYNSALAWQPDWVPVLTARSVLLQRLGRSLEAQKDRLQADRQNPNATAFYMAKGRNGLMPFLALYPHDWYKTTYGLTMPDVSDEEETSPQTYFYAQYMSIINSPDTAMAVLALQQKVDQDVLASRRTLEELPRTYHQGVRKMLLANLSMLNHDYAEAINLYTDASLKDAVDWPELHYNRGLGYILLNNYMNGCEDLSSAAKDGFKPAVVMYQSLCNF